MNHYENSRSNTESAPALEGQIINTHTHTAPPTEPSALNERPEILPDVDAMVEAMGTTHEALGGFLKGFVDAARSGEMESGYAQFKGFSPSVTYAFKDETTGRDNYALLRSDYSICTHCNPQAEQWWTLVSFETGDTLDFAESHATRIGEHGEYTSERSGNHFISPEKIAELAGIKEHPYPDDDPVVEMLAASNTSYIGLFRPVTLRTSDQIDRYGAILSLRHPATEHTRVALGFDDASAMFEKLGEYGVEWLLKGVDDVEVPTVPVPIITDSFDGVRSILSRIGTWGPERREELLDLIEYVDIRGVEDWARPGNVRSLIWSSVKFDDAGSYEVTPDASLTRKLLCNQWDLVMGIYKAADGYYGESMSQKIGESRVTHNRRFSLNEERANVYSEVFSDVLMPIVDQARDALQIPDDVPQAQQAKYLLTKHHLLEKGLRISRDVNVQAQRPDMTVPQWGRACEVIDDVRFSGVESKEWELSDDARTVLEGYGLDTARIAHMLKTAPGVSSDQMLRDAYRGRWQL